MFLTLCWLLILLLSFWNPICMCIYIYMCVCVCVCARVRTQLLLSGPGLELGLQFTCIVGLVFPTKGNSLPSDPMTPLSSHELPFFPLWVALPLGGTSSLSLSFTLYFLLRIANPHSLLNSTIYTLRLVEVSWLHSGLTRVCGVQFWLFLARNMLYWK